MLHSLLCARRLIGTIKVAVVLILLVVPSTARAQTYMLTDAWADDFETEEPTFTAKFWVTALTDDENWENTVGVDTSVRDPYWGLISYGSYMSGDNHARLDLEVWQDPDNFVEGENSLDSTHYQNSEVLDFTFFGIGSYRVSNRYQFNKEEVSEYFPYATTWWYLTLFCTAECQKYWLVLNPYAGGPAQFMHGTGISYRFLFFSKCQISYRQWYFPFWPACYPV